MAHVHGADSAHRSRRHRRRLDPRRGRRSHRSRRSGRHGRLGAIHHLSAIFDEDAVGRAEKKTLVINAMVLFIILGGTMFTTIFRFHGGGELVEALIEYLQLSPNGMAALFLAIIFVLGIVLDWVSIVLIVVPIFSPLLSAAGIDQIWFAVMAIIMIQTSYLTPPMAPSIFYLKGIAPPEMTYKEMYYGVMPFVGLQLLVLVIIALYPPTATYLPVLFLGNWTGRAPKSARRTDPYNLKNNWQTPRRLVSSAA